MSTVPPTRAAAAGDSAVRAATASAASAPAYAATPDSPHTKRYAVTKIHVETNASPRWRLPACTLWKVTIKQAIQIIDPETNALLTSRLSHRERLHGFGQRGQRPHVVECRSCDVAHK